VARRPGRSLAALCAGTLFVCALCSCASTIQQHPIPHNELEYMVAAPFPVYWLGASFHGMEVSEVVHDPGDAWTVDYGSCLEGGEGACVPPLRIVTSPDNSFLPGGATTTRAGRIRGVHAELAQGGDTLVIPTAGVVLDVYATSPAIAAAAARTAVPINEAGSPDAPLRPALANTGFGETPLPDQVPSPLRKLP
jgi:hypothetical protein